MHMQLYHLTDGQHQVSEIEIHAFEMGLYLLKAKVDNQYVLITDKAGKPIHFHSINEIREELADCPLEQAYLVHQTPYDEMVGQADEANIMRMKLPLH